MRESLLAMSTRERATFCIQEFQGSQSVISQAPGQASLARLRGVAFAACTRRRETWVLVVQAVPFSSGGSGWSCTKESHLAHVGRDQCEGGYTQLSLGGEVKSQDLSPAERSRGARGLHLKHKDSQLQSQPCDLIDTILKTDTAGHVRCESSKTRVKAYHLSIRIYRAIGHAVNRGEKNMHRRLRQSRAPRVYKGGPARRNRTTFEHFSNCHQSQCQPNTVGL
jgi:hypothetical protein